MAWNYSVLVKRVGGAPFKVEPPVLRVAHADDENGVLQSVLVRGWTNDSATTWAHTVARYEDEGTEVWIFRSRGRTGKATVHTHRRYEVREGVTRRVDR